MYDLPRAYDIVFDIDTLNFWIWSRGLLLMLRWGCIILIQF